MKSVQRIKRERGYGSTNVFEQNTGSEGPNPRKTKEGVVQREDPPHPYLPASLVLSQGLEQSSGKTLAPRVRFGSKESPVGKFSHPHPPFFKRTGTDTNAPT